MSVRNFCSCALVFFLAGAHSYIYYIIHFLYKDQACSGVTVLQRTIRRYADGARLITTVYRKDPNPSDIRKVGRPLREDAHAVIYNWHVNSAAGDPRGGPPEESYGHSQLDRQG